MSYITRAPKAFILDVDNTLLNTDAIKVFWTETLKQKYKIKKVDFINAYKKSKVSAGYIDYDKLSGLIGVDRSFFHETPFKRFLFPNTIKAIQKLKKLGVVYIFSLGDPFYQKEKITKSGIEKTVGKNRVIITQNKKLGLRSRLAILLCPFKHVDPPNFAGHTFTPA